MAKMTAHTAITKKMLTEACKELGIQPGDKVMVHSALSSFGNVEGGADTIIDSLLAAAGTLGTIIMPTFGSSDAVFDPQKSATSLGIIAETFRKRNGTLRSRHPVASAAAYGPDAHYIIGDHEKAHLAHGPNTPYTRLCELKGKVLLLGVDLDRMTLLHSAEEMLHLPYLRPITAKYKDERGKTVSGTWEYFPGPHRNFISLQTFLRSAGLVKEATIGNCKARLFDAAGVLALLLKKLNNQPDLFLSPNPNLPDGIRQRADIFKSKLSARRFTVAADSQFAGKYLEEIIENLHTAGIGHLVLSTVNNTPWHKVPQEKRNWYLRGLADAGINIAAIKFMNTPAVRIKDLLAEANSRAVILPSTINSAVFKDIATNVNVLMENVGLSGIEMVKYLDNLRKQHGNIAAAFDPLGFVQAGENPFLMAYTKTSIKNMIGALYINDGLATGERTNLEEGLAEIKELISILLCRTFSGLFILQGKSPAEFRQTASKFMHMYEEVQ